MPLVNSLLDVFFRTLDAVDAARERVDKALGRQPRPAAWTTEWSPSPEVPSARDVVRDARVTSTYAEKASTSLYTERPAAPAPQSPSTSPATGAKRTTKSTKKSAPKKAAGKNDSAVPKAVKGSKLKAASRKGSVDRSGKDFDSPRARAIVERLRNEGIGVITEDAQLEGKRVLARVLWSLSAADKAGSELGLTAADASALLYMAANVEVFATNVARTCRDETDLIEESEPDGRSKRYKLTAAGKAAAAKLDVRSLS
jgi:hypothetical protein